MQQIDIGEDTGPRTVVSGLVHYIPIEQMQDKYLVAVVCHFRPVSVIEGRWLSCASATSSLQTCGEWKALLWFYAWVSNPL